MFDAYMSAEHSHGGLAAMADKGRDAQITVFLNRQRFEYGIGEMLKKAQGQHAVLHMRLRGEGGSAATISHRSLNLVGSTLRAGLSTGAVAYLGGAEFAVLLQDTDAWRAAAYARVAVDIANSMQPASGDGQAVKACIGGVLTGHNHDGEYLLELAAAASEQAWEKPGCKLHLLHTPE